MKAVVVTGASRGLGLAIVQRLVADGYMVIAVSRSIPEELSSVVEQNPDAIVTRPFDISDIDGIAEFARGLIKEFPEIYGLVNNAGIGTDGVLATMHVSDIDKLIRTNLTGPIMMSKFLMRPMLRHKAGRIVNISSIIASTGYHGLSVYGATKLGWRDLPGRYRVKQASSGLRSTA